MSSEFQREKKYTDLLIISYIQFTDAIYQNERHLLKKYFLNILQHICNPILFFKRIDN